MTTKSEIIFELSEDDYCTLIAHIAFGILQLDRAGHTADAEQLINIRNRIQAAWTSQGYLSLAVDPTDADTERQIDAFIDDYLATPR